MYCCDQELIALNLILGGACNLRCPYCLQDENVNNRKGNPEEFLLKFKEFVHRNKIRKIKGVHYWGGEPLLYWRSIKTVLLGLDRLGVDVDLHRITSNGTLIDDDYIEFVNQNPKILTVISLHDALITNEQWKKIGRIKRVCLSGLVHHLKSRPGDYLHIWEKIREITGREMPIGLYPAHATDGCNSRYWLTKHDIAQYFEDFRDLICPLMSFGHPYCRALVSGFMFEMNARQNSVMDSKCFNAKVLSIDLFGNRFTCHHNNIESNKVSNIFERKVFIGQPLSWKLPEKCQSCGAFSTCKGACMITNDHDNECYWERRKWGLYKYIVQLTKNEF